MRGPEPVDITNAVAAPHSNRRDTSGAVVPLFSACEIAALALAWFGGAALLAWFVFTLAGMR